MSLHSCMVSNCHQKKSIVPVKNQNDTWICTTSSIIHQCKCDANCTPCYPNPEQRGNACCYVSRFELPTWVVESLNTKGSSLFSKKQKLEILSDAPLRSLPVSFLSFPDNQDDTFGGINSMGKGMTTATKIEMEKKRGKGKRIAKNTQMIPFDREIQLKLIIGYVVSNLLNDTKKRKSVNHNYEKQSAEAAKDAVFQFCRQLRDVKTGPTWWQLEPIVVKIYNEKKWLNVNPVDDKVIEYYTDIVYDFLVIIEKYGIPVSITKGSKTQKSQKIDFSDELRAMGALYLLTCSGADSKPDPFLVAHLPPESMLKLWPPFSATKKTLSVKFLRECAARIPPQNRKEVFASIFLTFQAYKQESGLTFEKDHVPFLYLFNH